MRDNINTIAALKLVVQRPRDLTRADLKELRLALDRKGYSEANLRRAWADAKNEDIAASIIGFVRQAALGDPLMPYDDRVRAAMRRIMASRPVDRAAEALAEADRRADRERNRRRPRGDRQGPVSSPMEAFNRLNKVFGGELEERPCRDQRRNVEEGSLMTSTTDIVAKLWGLCHVLRDDGVTYNEYVTELTYLLFLKMLEETRPREPAAGGLSLGRSSPSARGWSNSTTTSACCSISASQRSRTRWSAPSSPTRRPGCASRRTSRR